MLSWESLPSTTGRAILWTFAFTKRRLLTKRCSPRKNLIFYPTLKVLHLSMMQVDFTSVSQSTFVLTKDNTRVVMIQIDYPAIVKYNFEVKPEKNFTHGNHPSLIHYLCFPQLTWFRHSSSVKLQNKSKVQLPSCSLISCALLPAAEIVDDFSHQVVTTTHTIIPSTIPERKDVVDQKTSIVLNPVEGEWAMLIWDHGQCTLVSGRMLPKRQVHDNRQFSIGML